MSLTDLIQSTVGTRSPVGRLIDTDNTLFGKTHSLIGSEEQTETFWGAVFWQIALASPEFPKLLKTNGFSAQPGRDAETIIVPTCESPSNRVDTFFDLVVLSQSFSGPPKSFEFKADYDALEKGYRNWTERVRSENTRLVNSGMIRRDEAARRGQLIQQFTSEFAPNLLKKRTFNVVLTPFPDLEFTAVPPSPWSVGATTAGASTSTAGALVQDSSGCTGVTACRHGILGGTIGTAVGLAVTVDGHPGTVKYEDVVSDSCFIELPAGSIPRSRRTTSGPLVSAATKSQPVWAAVVGLGDRR